MVNIIPVKDHHCQCKHSAMLTLRVKLRNFLILEQVLCVHQWSFCIECMNGQQWIQTGTERTGHKGSHVQFLTLPIL